MIELNIIIWILIVHFLADFGLQSEWMAKNKSSPNHKLAAKALGLHVSIYTLCLLPFGWQFAVVNRALHFGTDWITSRLMKHCHERGNTRKFFYYLGYDQLMHYITLFTTYALLI